MAEVSLVDPNYVSAVWDKVESILRKSLHTAHGRFTMESILREIVNFQQHLWIVFDDDKEIVAALTTRFIDYPDKRMLAGQFLGGRDIMQWRDPMLETLEKWAKDNHCTGVEMTGRKGFSKVLATHGWTPEYTVFEKMFEEKNDG
jgi:hypothetical protein